MGGRILLKWISDLKQVGRTVRAGLIMAHERDQWRVPITEQRYSNSRPVETIFSSTERLRWVKSVSQRSSAPVGTTLHCRPSLLLPWLLVFLKLCMCLIRRSERLLFLLYWQNGWGGWGTLLTPGLNVGATCLLKHVGSLPAECAQISARIQS